MGDGSCTALWKGWGEVPQDEQYPVSPCCSEPHESQLDIMLPPQTIFPLPQSSPPLLRIPLTRGLSPNYPPSAEIVDISRGAGPQ